MVFSARLPQVSKIGWRPGGRRCPGAALRGTARGLGFGWRRAQRKFA